MVQLHDLPDEDDGNDSDDSDASTQVNTGGLGLNKHGKPASFYDLMEKASAVKMARIKEKRREWDNAPDFMKSTLAYERDENIKASRLLPLQERLARAEAHKEDGNERFKANDLLGAMREYTKALALFRWFERIPVDGGDEQLPYRRAEQGFEGGERTQVERLIVTALTNIGAVLVKDNHPQDAVWACTEALLLQPNNVKALYRRATALAALNSGADLEAAVNDLTKASKISPSNKEVREALQNLGAEHIAQRRRDQALYGAGLRRGGIYKDSDVGGGSGSGGPAIGGAAGFQGMRNRRMGGGATGAGAGAGAGGAGAGTGGSDGGRAVIGEGGEDDWEPAVPLPPLTEDAKQALEYEARKLGLDMDNPRIRQEFYRWADRRREEDMIGKAKELGLDLRDKDVQRVLAAMQAESEAGRDPHAVLQRQKTLLDGRRGTWRRVFARLFSPDRKLNVQNALYALLLARLLWNLAKSFAGMRALNAAVPGSADDLDPEGLWN